jgi:uncharacterized peroxidase-related enzyme
MQACPSIDYNRGPIVFGEPGRWDVGYLQKRDLGETRSNSIPLQEAFGFLPNLFHAQTLLPRIQEAVSGLVAALLVRKRALTRIQQESIMLCVAAACRNAYCVTLHHHTLHSLGMPYDQIDQLLVDHRRASLSPPDKALLDFVLKLATRGLWLSGADVGALRQRGFEDQSVLKAILVTALTHFLCTLSAGLGPSPDFEPISITCTKAESSELPEPNSFVGGTSGPYLARVELAQRPSLPYCSSAFTLSRISSVPRRSGWI